VNFARNLASGELFEILGGYRANFNRDRSHNDGGKQGHQLSHDGFRS